MRHILFYALFIGIGLQTTAQSVRIELDKDSMLIGDHVLLSLSVDYLEGQRVYLPEFTDSTLNFDWIESFPADTLEQTISQNILLTQFDAGNYKISDIPALLIQKNGQVDTLYSNSAQIFVNTVKVDTSQAFQPIKPVKSLPFPWRSFLKKLATYLLPILLLIALIVLYILRRKKFKLFEEKPKTMLDYYNEAIEALQDLENKKLWQNDKTKEYYLSMSEILRAYIEGRFGVAAMESTTDEIKEDLFLDAALKQKLSTVLEQADLAKFARFKPLGDENIKMMKLSKDFIRHTKPKSIEELHAK